MTADIDKIADLSQKIAAAGQRLFEISGEDPVSYFSNFSVQLETPGNGEHRTSIKHDPVIRAELLEDKSAHAAMEIAQIFAVIDASCPQLLAEISKISLLAMDSLNSFDVSVLHRQNHETGLDWEAALRMNRIPIALFSSGREDNLRATLNHLVSVPEEFLKPQTGYPALRRFQAQSGDFMTQAPSPEAALYLFQIRTESVRDFVELIDQAHFTARIAEFTGCPA